jgi:hypothetical protein
LRFDGKEANEGGVVAMMRDCVEARRGEGFKVVIFLEATLVFQKSFFFMKRHRHHFI